MRIRTVPALLIGLGFLFCVQVYPQALYIPENTTSDRQLFLEGWPQTFEQLKSNQEEYASNEDNAFWEEVKKRMNKAEAGSALTVSASKAAYVPASILLELKGMDLTLHIHHDSYQIEIYGEDMYPVPENQVYYTFADLDELYQQPPSALEEEPMTSSFASQPETSPRDPAVAFLRSSPETESETSLSLLQTVSSPENYAPLFLDEKAVLLPEGETDEPAASSPDNQEPLSQEGGAEPFPANPEEIPPEGTDSGRNEMDSAEEPNMPPEDMGAQAALAPMGGEGLEGAEETKTQDVTILPVLLGTMAATFLACLAGFLYRAFWRMRKNK